MVPSLRTVITRSLPAHRRRIASHTRWKARISPSPSYEKPASPACVLSIRRCSAVLRSQSRNTCTCGRHVICLNLSNSSIVCVMLMSPRSRPCRMYGSASHGQRSMMVMMPGVTLGLFHARRMAICSAISRVGGSVLLPLSAL